MVNGNPHEIINKWAILISDFDEIEKDYGIKIDRVKPYAYIQGCKIDDFEGIFVWIVSIRTNNGKYKWIQVKPKSIDLVYFENTFLGEGI